MCKQSKYYRLMGCVTWTVATALVIGLTINLVNIFINNPDAWAIISTILNILAGGTIGLGVGSLFFSYANDIDFRIGNCK